MKQVNNEWISISDLMAGIVSVIVMLLVVSILQQAINASQQRLAERTDLIIQQELTSAIFKEIKEDFDKQNISSMVSFDFQNHKITFKEGIFQLGSARITPLVQRALTNTKPKVTEFLDKLANGVIYIEGHSDNTPVLHPVLDKARYGAVYDDNYTLSAARAREARNVLLGELDEKYGNRIIVAGYGYSKPLKGLDPSNAANRRIEIRFLLEQENHEN